MIEIRCNRCGKLIPLRTDVTQDRPQRADITIFTTGSFMFHKVDLCDECEDEFFEWVERKNEDPPLTQQQAVIFTLKQISEEIRELIEEKSKDAIGNGYRKGITYGLLYAREVITQEIKKIKEEQSNNEKRKPEHV